MIVASGLSSFAAFSTSAICWSVAESTLLITMTSAIRKFVSPGWYVVSCPARRGSATVMCTVGL